ETNGGWGTGDGAWWGGSGPALFPPRPLDLAADVIGRPAGHRPVERPGEPAGERHGGPGGPRGEHEGPAPIESADDPPDGPLGRLPLRERADWCRRREGRAGELALGPRRARRPDAHPRAPELVTDALDQAVHRVLARGIGRGVRQTHEPEDRG